MFAAFSCIVLCLLIVTSSTNGAEPPCLTTLSNPAIKYGVPDKPYVILRRAGIEAVIADNRAVDDEVLPGHRAGYSGVAALKHAKRPETLFIPPCGGLNFEHIHDGTVQDSDVLFEPRRVPMELRLIDENTAELYQKPSTHYRLESCLRYQLLEDGTIEMTFECIAHKPTFSNGYIGLFWASYIHQPESLDIHFIGHAADKVESLRIRSRGHPTDKPGEIGWIRGVTPAHGVLSTHLASGDRRNFKHDPKFPLTLVFNRSKYRYSEPWYYGVSHGMAFAQMFRPKDEIRLSQSPSGGGPGNPAWDFQYIIADYKLGRRYQMVMRAMYLPFESSEQMERATAGHRKALASQ